MFDSASAEGLGEKNKLPALFSLSPSQEPPSHPIMLNVVAVDRGRIDRVCTHVDMWSKDPKRHEQKSF